jgi:uncharacterized protein YgiM (DUF1202 family)
MGSFDTNYNLLVTLMLLTITNIVALIYLCFQTLKTHTQPKWSKDVYQWAKPGNLDELSMEWYVPGKPELEAAHHLLKKYLQPNLDALMRYSLNKIIWSPKDLALNGFLRI